MTEKIVNWGVISTAKVGRLAVIPAMQRASNGRPLAIASRSAEKAQRAADEFAIPRAYGSYEALLADSDVDAVYVPLPNGMHREWTIRSAEAGKHVLCEKPLAVNAHEADDMIAACERHDVHLMEAFMYRFHPRTLRVKELIDAGAIGEVRLIRAAFVFILADQTDHRYRREMGGGALLDVGGYTVSLSRWLIGAEPVEVTAMAHFGTEGGIDETIAGMLRFPGGEISVACCSFQAALRQSYEIVGSEGVIEAPLGFIPGQGEESQLVLTQGGSQEIITFPGADQYQRMVEHFATSVLSEEPPRYPAEEGRANMRVLDALALAARRGTVQRL